MNPALIPALPDILNAVEFLLTQHTTTDPRVSGSVTEVQPTVLQDAEALLKKIFVHKTAASATTTAPTTGPSASPSAPTPATADPTVAPQPATDAPDASTGQVTQGI